MFDALKNLGNLPGLMARAREMQEKMKTLQDELAKRQVTADSGGGMVTAIVNGKLELVKLRIEKARLPDPNDFEMLEDLITAAVAAAQNKAGEMIKDEMSKLAGDLGLPPGMLPPSGL